MPEDDTDQSSPAAVIAGTLEPLVHGERLPLRLGSRNVDATYETLRMELPNADGLSTTDLPRAVISIAGPATLVFATVDDHEPTLAQRRSSAGPPAPTPTLWIRRPAAAAGSPVDATVRTPSWERTPGQEFHFVSDRLAGANDAKLPKRWLRALSGAMNVHSGPFYQFAVERLAALGGAPQSAGLDRFGNPRVRTNDLQELMATLSGQARIQEALQSNDDLAVAMSSKRRSAGIDSVKPPELPTHPYADMLARLGKRVPDEPLATAIPAEFYYLRARSLTALLDLLDQGELWADPAAQVLDSEARDASISERYETALGLRRTALTRLLGPDVVSEVALTGSDPYVREGSDLTLVFRVKNRSLFEAALVQGLSERSRGHGDLKTTESPLAKGASKVESADGAVRRVRASSGDLEIVSNSENAVARVLAAIAKARPRLADEPDFRYMLARDASEPEDILGYVGERFVSAVISPRQKILEARRQLAVAELARPGYAALLHGWLNGKSPVSVEEVVKGGLIDKKQLAHSDGAPIDWTPGKPARSLWGTIASQTPLIDLPPIDKVTPEEAAAYSSFSMDYRRDWAEHVDPIAVRLRIVPAEHRLTARVRVLPVSQNRDLRDLLSMVGQTKVNAAPLGRGVRAVLGVGRDAELRREASEAVHAFGRTLQIDWLGDWAMVGLDDGKKVAEVASDSPEVPPLMLGPHERGSDEFRMLTELPLYAGVAIRHSAAAAVAITALKHMGEGMLKWVQASDHRKMPVWRVCEARRSESRTGPCLFYTLTDSALYVTLSEPQIHRLIDADLDGTGPAAPSARDPGSQFLFDLAPRPGGGMYLVMAWLLEAALLGEASGSRDTAEALFHGAPDLTGDADRLRHLALADFGAVPVTVDGKFYVARADGIADPVWGTPHRPSWAPLPIAGSPVQRLLDAVPRFRSRMGFDVEPGGPANTPTLSLDLGIEMSLAPAH